MIPQPLRIVLAIVYGLIIIATLSLIGFGLWYEDVSSEIASQIGLWVFLLHAASTLFLCGLIWTVQVVNYPLFANVGDQSFSQYHQGHLWRMTTVVAVPMILELATGILLFIFRPFSINMFAVILGMVLIGFVWLSTVFLQVPRHEALSQNYANAIQNQLTVSNWIRTMAWSFRSLLVLWLFYHGLS